MLWSCRRRWIFSRRMSAMGGKRMFGYASTDRSIRSRDLTRYCSFVRRKLVAAIPAVASFMDCSS
jgi:hypothetical protein